MDCAFQSPVSETHRPQDRLCFSSCPRGGSEQSILTVQARGPVSTGQDLDFCYCPWAPEQLRLSQGTWLVPAKAEPRAWASTPATVPDCAAPLHVSKGPRRKQKPFPKNPSNTGLKTLLCLAEEFIRKCHNYTLESAAQGTAPLATAPQPGALCPPWAPAAAPRGIALGGSPEVAGAAGSLEAVATAGPTASAGVTSKPEAHGTTAARNRAWAGAGHRRPTGKPRVQNHRACIF